MANSNKKRKTTFGDRKSLIIKQGGICGFSYEPIVRANLNGKKIEIATPADVAHISDFSSNGLRYDDTIDSESRDNKIYLDPTTHREVDKENPENYTTEMFHNEKENLEKITSDSEVYKTVDRCDCSYIKRFKKKK